MIIMDTGYTTLIKRTKTISLERNVLQQIQEELCLFVVVPAQSVGITMLLALDKTKDPLSLGQFS